MDFSINFLRSFKSIHASNVRSPLHRTVCSRSKHVLWAISQLYFLSSCGARYLPVMNSNRSICAWHEPVLEWELIYAHPVLPGSIPSFFYVCFLCAKKTAMHKQCTYCQAIRNTWTNTHFCLCHGKLHSLGTPVTESKICRSRKWVLLITSYFSLLLPPKQMSTKPLTLWKEPVRLA